MSAWELFHLSQHKENKKLLRLTLHTSGAMPATITSFQILIEICHAMARQFLQSSNLLTDLINWLAFTFLTSSSFFSMTSLQIGTETWNSQEETRNTRTFALGSFSHTKKVTFYI